MSWPFGKCQFTRTYIELTGLFARGRADRHEVVRVLICRRRFRAVELTVKCANGTTLTPTFFPTGTGSLIDALRSHHWPVEIQVFKPRVSTKIWAGLCCALVVGAGVQAAVHATTVDRLRKRSVATPAVITSMIQEGGRQRAFATYAVGSVMYTKSLIVTRDKHTGDQLKLRYLPESPARTWEQGHDPPGTGEWWLGPLVPIAVFFGVASWQRRTLARRKNEPPEPGIGT